MTKVDEAYQALNNIVEELSEIEVSVEDEFEHNPFGYLDSNLSHQVRELRPKLVDHYARKYMDEYTPNYKPKVKFQDLMDEETGREGFDSEVIREYFVKLASDVEKLRELSWSQIRERAGHLRGGSYYDRPKLNEIVQGSVLILRAHTWNKTNNASRGYVRYYSKDNYEAMQSLIDVITLKGDPAQKPQSTFLTDHLDKSNEVEQFYGKHIVKHKTVAAFQFYKNDKLKIWFKKPQYAKAVAEEMLSVDFT